MGMFSNHKRKRGDSMNKVIKALAIGAIIVSLTLLFFYQTIAIWTQEFPQAWNPLEPQIFLWIFIVTVILVSAYVAYRVFKWQMERVKEAIKEGIKEGMKEGKKEGDEE